MILIIILISRMKYNLSFLLVIRSCLSPPMTHWSSSAIYWPQICISPSQWSYNSFFAVIPIILLYIHCIPHQHSKNRWKAIWRTSVMKNSSWSRIYTLTWTIRFWKKKILFWCRFPPFVRKIRSTTKNWERRWMYFLFHLFWMS